MKINYAIIVAFVITVATSSLLELDFFSKNLVRYSLVVLLILVEVVIAYFYVKALMISSKKPTE